MRIPANPQFWFGFFRMVIVAIVLIVLASNMNYFIEIFESVDKNVSAILLWACLMLYALNFFGVPKGLKESYSKEV